MTNQKNRDDEKRNWLIVGILFTGVLLGIDFGYSSYSEMATIARVALYLSHAGLALLWVIAMIKFNDPNFDIVRKWIVGLCIVLGLIVGIHHAVVREDKQVIIDSKENSLR